MPKKKTHGFCCICGAFGELNEEHLPPKNAYNKSTVFAFELNGSLIEDRSKGKKIQGGVKVHTLCENCNSNTGSWYVPEYIAWARGFTRVIFRMRYLGITSGTVRLINVYPLRFLKQVVVCFFSVIGTHTFSHKYPDLRRFVLDKRSQILPEGFKFYMNLYPFSQPQTALRNHPVMGKISVVQEGNSIFALNAMTFSELAHPPFQLIMVMPGELYVGGTEITHFRNFAYGEATSIDLEVKVIDSKSHYLHSK